MAAKKVFNRMYEPWGYRDQNKLENEEWIGDSSDFFVDAEYRSARNEICFYNEEGDEVCSIDVNEFPIPSIESTNYDPSTEILTISFKNGTNLEVNLETFVDSVNKLVEDETNRATRAEGVLLNLIERAIENQVAMQQSLNDEINRAVSAETSLNTKIEQETERAVLKEKELSDRIDRITSGSPIAELDELIEKLGYKDNDTLVRTNEHEVAFGEYNVSNTDTEPSGQTIFSIGIGTSDDDRRNGIEVRKDGAVFMWVEGEFMNVNNLLAQISHEIYDAY